MRKRPVNLIFAAWFCCVTLRAYLLAAALAAIRDPKAPPLLPHEFAAQQAPPN